MFDRNYCIIYKFAKKVGLINILFSLGKIDNASHVGTQMNFLIMIKPASALDQRWRCMHEENYTGGDGIDFKYYITYMHTYMHVQAHTHTHTQLSSPPNGDIP